MILTCNISIEGAIICLSILISLKVLKPSLILLLYGPPKFYINALLNIFTFFSVAGILHLNNLNELIRESDQSKLLRIIFNFS